MLYQVRLEVHLGLISSVELPIFVNAQLFVVFERVHCITPVLARQELLFLLNLINESDWKGSRNDPLRNLSFIGVVL